MKQQLKALLYLLLIIVAMLLAAATFLISGIIVAVLLALAILGLIPGGLFLLCIGLIVLVWNKLESAGKSKIPNPKS